MTVPSPVLDFTDFPNNLALGFWFDGKHINSPVSSPGKPGNTNEYTRAMSPPSPDSDCGHSKVCFSDSLVSVLVPGLQVFSWFYVHGSGLPIPPDSNCECTRPVMTLDTGKNLSA